MKRLALWNTPQRIVSLDWDRALFGLGLFVSAEDAGWHCSLGFLHLVVQHPQVRQQRRRRDRETAR